MRAGKTGGWGSTWVELDKPKPPAVDDHYRYWTSPPPNLSPRCRYWLRQIECGWRPNRRIQREGREAASWYGVYVWELTEQIWPALPTRHCITNIDPWETS